MCAAHSGCAAPPVAGMGRFGTNVLSVAAVVLLYAPIQLSSPLNRFALSRLDVSAEACDPAPAFLLQQWGEQSSPPPVHAAKQPLRILPANLRGGGSRKIIRERQQRRERKLVSPRA